MSVGVLISHDIDDTDLEAVRSVSDLLDVRKAATLEEAVSQAGDAEVIFAGHWSDDLWKAAPGLKWVQSWGAGVERFLTPDFVAAPITLTNAAGIYAVPIAEHVMAFILYFSRRFNRFVRWQSEHRWEWGEPDELAGKTVGIVGLGGIGSQVARRAKAFDVRVIAVRNHPEKPSPDADEVRGPDGLDWLLTESDYVALCAALTPRTRHLIGAAQLQRMKPTAYLINIGRGALVDEPALIKALREGQIAGAGLDVFETEPLPQDSPLWDMPNVMVTPHNSGSSPRSFSRTMDLFRRNLERYLAGQQLLNVVDKAAGY